MKRFSLYDAHVTFGLRQFGKRTMEDGHIAAVHGRGLMVSKLYRRGVAYDLITVRKNRRTRHTVNVASEWCKLDVCRQLGGHDKVARR